MPNRNATLLLKDLATPESFRVWIKQHLNHLYLKKNIPEEHLLIFLDYLRTVIRDNPTIYQPEWMDLIRELENKIKSIIKSKE